MKVSQQNTDKLNAVISIEITKEDYREKVEKALRNYRQRANIPGFRKGMAPTSLIKRMYEKSAQGEEINQLISESLFGYIKENSLNILGEPLPAESQEKIDFENQEDFVFDFDIALAPEITIDLSKKDKVDYYHIEVSDEDINKQLDNLRARYGTNESVQVADEKSMLKGSLVELAADGQEKEAGIAVENAVISPSYFKDDAQKALFAAATVGARIVFSPAIATAGHGAEMASMLHIDKEAAAENTSEFAFTIADITSFKPAEMNQTFFDAAFGEGTVTTEAACRDKVRGTQEAMLAPESDYKFGLDVRTLLEKKLSGITLPEAFLKRWLLISDKEGNRTPESVEEEFPKMLPELIWHLIKEQVAKQYEVKVEQADVMNVAKKSIIAQFAQYGMSTFPDDILDRYAKEMLGNKEQARSLVDRATEEKILAVLKEQVTLTEQKTTSEKFYALFEQK